MKTKSVAGDTFTLYYGEFLISPVPLELSFNYCSHKCAYCFANLNKPSRRADIGATVRMLASYKSRETLEAKLLRDGYPVLVSNRVDPFAASNYRQALPILAAMTELGIPITLQTRGGYGINEALQFLRPSVWQISVCMMDDELRQRIEPGAPSITSRLELIAQLRDQGHSVTVAFNPAVPEWQPDPTALFRAAQRAGAEGVWIEPMHLNPDQVANMTPRERAILTDAIIKRSQRRTARDDLPYFHLARRLASELGLAVYSVHQPTASTFYEPWRRHYGRKLFPVGQDLINLLAQEQPDTLIPVAEIADGFAQRLPQGAWPVGHYIGSTSRQLFRGANPLPSKATYRDLLGIILTDVRCKSSPLRTHAVSLAAEKTPKGWILLVDRNGMPYYVYNRTPNPSLYVHVET